MHLKRWITSIVAIPVLVGLIYKGSPPVFAGFIALISLIALWEYFFIIFSGNISRILKPIPLLGAAAGGVIVVSSLYAAFQAMLLVLLINLMLCALLSMPRYKAGPEVMQEVAAQIQGVLYIPLSLSMLVLLRNGPDGVAWIFFLLFVVFFGDVGAFYMGRFFGRRKLSPAISPGKTVEGAIGGIAANVLMGVAFRWLVLPELPLGLTILFVMAIGAMGQVGDLFESELKRAAEIKDSGTILPGYGGILDRIDALLFAGPIAFGFKVFIF